MNVPIVELRVENMRHSIVAAFSEHMLKMDKDVQAAVDAICKPQHIAALIQKEAATAIERAIHEEIDHFYRYGAGRQAVRDAVAASLEARSDELKKW